MESGMLDKKREFFGEMKVLDVPTAGEENLLDRFPMSHVRQLRLALPREELYST